CDLGLIRCRRAPDERVLSRSQGSARGALREGIPLTAGPASRRKHVPGCAPCRNRPDDTVSPHGQARLQARRVLRRLRVTVRSTRGARGEASAGEMRSVARTRAPADSPSSFTGGDWAGLERPPDAIPGLVWSALSKAAVRAVDSWPAELHGYPGADDVRPSMRRICLAVRHTLEGRRE